MQAAHRVPLGDPDLSDTQLLKLQKMGQGQGCDPALRSIQETELPHSSNVPPGEGTGDGLPTAQAMQGPGLQTSTTGARAGLGARA